MQMRIFPLLWSTAPIHLGTHQVSPTMSQSSGSAQPANSNMELIQVQYRERRLVILRIDDFWVWVIYKLPPRPFVLHIDFPPSNRTSGLDCAPFLLYRMIGMYDFGRTSSIRAKILLFKSEVRNGPCSKITSESLTFSLLRFNSYVAEMKRSLSGPSQEQSSRLTTFPLTRIRYWKSNMLSGN